jgi:hypothetical protein
MASEDSDQVVPGLAMIHRLRDLCDPDQPAGRETVSGGDPLETRGELLEIVALRRPYWMVAEERDYASHEFVPPSDDELVEILLVVVVPPVQVDPARSKELLKLSETGRASRALRDDEPMEDLIAGSVAPPVMPVGLSDETDGEASLSVYKTNHPASTDQSFLLVVRTAWIVTAHTAYRMASTRRIHRVSQHIAECLPVCYQTGRQRLRNETLGRL